MEVALSLSWLLLGLTCALFLVNKLKIKLKTKTGIPGGGSEQRSQVLRVTDMALWPPVTMYRVHLTSPSLLNTLLAPTGWLRRQEILLLPETCAAASMEGNSTQSGMSGRGVECEGVWGGGGVTSAWLKGQQHWASDSLLLGHLWGERRRSETQWLVSGPQLSPCSPHSPLRGYALVGEGVAEGAHYCGWPAG